MLSIFSTQNLQTFLRRKYLRPPSRPPGPPGPPGRGGRRSPPPKERSPPPEGRSPEGRSEAGRSEAGRSEAGRSPDGRSPPEDPSVPAGDADLVSSAMMLLKNQLLAISP